MRTVYTLWFCQPDLAQIWKENQYADKNKPDKQKFVAVQQIS